jgi:hypothetical protein
MDYCGNCDIAYEGKDCPLCETMRTIEELNKELDKKGQKIGQLEDEIIELENKE